MINCLYFVEGGWEFNVTGTYEHRWALSPISVMSDIGLSLYRTVRYRTERLKICRIFRYRTKFFGDVRHLNFWNPAVRGALKTNRTELISWYCYIWVLIILQKISFCLCLCAMVLRSKFFFMSDSGLSDIGLSCFIIGFILYRTEGLQSDKFFFQYRTRRYRCRISATKIFDVAPTYAYEWLVQSNEWHGESFTYIILKWKQKL
jgi:hypothetical protein